MSKCKIFSVEAADITFQDGRSTKGFYVSFGAKSHKTDENGKLTIDGYVPFCYATKDGKARCDKFVGLNKLYPQGYSPRPGDLVDIEFELGTSNIVAVTKLPDQKQN